MSVIEVVSRASWQKEKGRMQPRTFFPSHSLPHHQIPDPITHPPQKPVGMVLNYTHPLMPSFLITKLTELPLPRPKTTPQPSTPKQTSPPRYEFAPSTSKTPASIPQRGGFEAAPTEGYLWTKEEDNVLLAVNLNSRSFVDPQLPGRSGISCRARLRGLGFGREVEGKHDTHIPRFLPKRQASRGSGERGRASAGRLREYGKLTLPGTCEEQISALPVDDKEEDGDEFVDLKGFKNLPIELRINIWKLVDSRESRMVEVHPVQFEVEYSIPNVNGRVELEHYSGSVTHFRSRTPTTVLMRICQESRTIALEIYRSASCLANPFLPDFVLFKNNFDTIYLSKPALDIWAGPRGRSFFIFPPFRRSNENDLLIGPQNYGTNIELSFPPRTPAGRTIMRLKTLALDIDWLLSHPTHDHEPSSARIRKPSFVFDSMSLHLPHATTILSHLFYLSDLEEVIFVFHRSTEYNLSAQMAVGNPHARERDCVCEPVRAAALSVMRKEFYFIERTLSGALLERYSRVGREMPVVRTIFLD
ncbi:hypothetical protein BDZ45DRAFT_77614 [Acephala macrosclerotiorum]|nr:hypothetical protein BDZ45DRAFT_77614 [Acephala macrosclerotiorum]